MCVLVCVCVCVFVCEEANKRAEGSSVQLLLFLVSVETQERPATELMLNNELGVRIYTCVCVCVCVCVCMCVCVCEYMKGLWGKLKCQRGSIYDTVHGIG